jgi:hypothetical protein
VRAVASALPSAAVLLAVVLVAAVAAGASTALPEKGTGNPLRNEDVVRMLVGGRPAKDVIATIRSAEVAFELSDEMAQELRLAGVPADVLAAMAARQAEVDQASAPAKPPDATVPAAAAGKTAIVVALRPDAARGETKSLLFPTRLDDAAARALQVGPSDEERTVTDLAVFLACRTADHVPDQWRPKSPLGSDFVSVARHEMLDFRPGATSLPRGKAPAGWSPPAPRGAPKQALPDLLALALPLELRGEVEPGVAHDLVVGVAIRVGDRYLEAAEVRKDGVVPGPLGLSLAVIVDEHGGDGRVTIELRFEGSAEAAAPER